MNSLKALNVQTRKQAKTKVSFFIDPNGEQRLETRIQEAIKNCGLKPTLFECGCVECPALGGAAVQKCVSRTVKKSGEVK